MPKIVPYTEEIAKEICSAIASSSKGIDRLCKENPHWPSRNTIYRWIEDNLLFRDMYARAKQFQIESLVDDLLDISDTCDGDTMVNINRARLKVDTRKWLAGKLCPRLYGDKNPQRDDNEDAISKVRVTE